MLQMEQFSVKANESVRALLNGIGFVWKKYFIYCVFNQEIWWKNSKYPTVSNKHVTVELALMRKGEVDQTVVQKWLIYA